MSGLDTRGMMHGFMQGYQFMDGALASHEARKQNAEMHELNKQSVMSNQRNADFEYGRKKDEQQYRKLLYATDLAAKGDYSALDELNRQDASNKKYDFRYVTSPEYRHAAKVTIDSLNPNTPSTINDSEVLDAADILNPDLIKNGERETLATAGFYPIPESMVPEHLKGKGPIVGHSVVARDENGKPYVAPRTVNRSTDKNDMPRMYPAKDLLDHTLGGVELSAKLSQMGSDQERAQYMHDTVKNLYGYMYGDLSGNKENLRIETIFDPKTGRKQKVALDGQGNIVQYIGGLEAPSEKGAGLKDKKRGIADAFNEFFKERQRLRLRDGGVSSEELADLQKDFVLRNGYDPLKVEAVRMSFVNTEGRFPDDEELMQSLKSTGLNDIQTQIADLNKKKENDELADVASKLNTKNYPEPPHPTSNHGSQTYHADAEIQQKIDDIDRTLQSGMANNMPISDSFREKLIQRKSDLESQIPKSSEQAKQKISQIDQTLQSLHVRLSSLGPGRSANAQKQTIQNQIQQLQAAKQQLAIRFNINGNYGLADR